MKKKILLALLLVAVFTCLFCVAVSATPQNYQSYEVELLDGSKITVYETNCWDQYQAHVHLCDTTYTEAPVDSEGTYALLDWSQVTALDFTNAWGHVYNSTTGEWENKVGTNAGYSFHLQKVNFTSKNATNLKRINTGKLTLVGGGTINNLPALEELVCGSKLKDIQWNAADNNKKLTTVDFTACENFTTIGQQAFKNCTALKTFTLPNTITSMGDNIFDGCSSLETINWPTSMTKIPTGTFYNCSALKFEIPTYVTKIGGNAFRNCDSLTSVSIHDGVTEIGSYAFAQCDNLTELVFTPNSQVSNNLIGIIMECPKVTSFTIPPLVTKLGYDNFWSCTSLTTINFHENITEITGGNNFNTCTALEKIEFPNSLTKLANGNLSGCKALKEIRLGNGLTSLGDGNLTLKSLERVYIPASLETIGAHILGYSNPADSSSNITFIFTGTKAQAEALQAMLKEYTETNAPDHVPNSSKFYDATLVSATEYDPDTTAPSGYHFVYGYNVCKAFYGNEHILLEENAENRFVGADYFTAYKNCIDCARNGCDVTKEEPLCDALFTSRGFSKSADSFSFTIVANLEEIAKYNALVDDDLDIKYGLVVSGINDGNPIGADGATNGANILKAECSQTKYSIMQIKMVNIPTTSYETLMHCCAYVVDNGKVTYLYDYKNDSGKIVEASSTTANQISYSTVPTKE